MTDTEINTDDLSRLELIDLIATLRDQVAASAVNGESGVDVLELQTQLAAAEDERTKARSELRSLKQAVTDKFKELVSESELELSTAKEACEELGCPAPVRKFDVEIVVRISVYGLEAEDADEAESLAQDAVSVDFNGGGEYDTWDTDSVELEVTEA